jgi:hypothetical protein
MRKQLEAAQATIPLPATANSPAPAAQQPAPAQAAAGAGPPELDFARPTERPGEPVTAGLAMGPGAGPEILGFGGVVNDSIGDTLRALYAQNPNNDILRLLELHDKGY